MICWGLRRKRLKPLEHLELLELLELLERDQEFGVISKTTRSMSGGESRSVRIFRRSLSSVTCLAMQANLLPLTVISTAGFSIMFWHQCLPCTLLDDA